MSEHLGTCPRGVTRRIRLAYVMAVRSNYGSKVFCKLVPVLNVEHPCHVCRWTQLFQSILFISVSGNIHPLHRSGMNQLVNGVRALFYFRVTDWEKLVGFFWFVQLRVYFTYLARIKPHPNGKLSSAFILLLPGRGGYHLPPGE